MGNHRRRGGKKDRPRSGRQRGPASNGGSGNNKSKQPPAEDNDDDDILAQLRRQRQKQKAKEEADATQSTEAASANPIVKPASRKGGFQYDPVRKRYFPKSAFNSHGNNDVCVHHLQKQVGADDAAGGSSRGPRRAALINRQPSDSDSSVTGGDLQRVIFRGTSLPCVAWRCDDNACPSVEWGAKRQNTTQSAQKAARNIYVPCTDRSTLLLATSLEYCTSVSRRGAIATMLASRSISRRGKVVPNQSTLDRIRNGTEECMHPCIDLEERATCKKQTIEPNGEPIRGMRASRIAGAQDTPSEFSMVLKIRPHTCFSMLPPLMTPWQPRSSTLPYDCECKEHLSPTTPTFDVLPHYVQDPLPRVSTAMPRLATISNDAICYREYDLRSHRWRTWELKSCPRIKIHGVRIAPLDPSAVGYLAYDSNKDESEFVLQTAADANTWDASYALASPVNDFCFAKDRETLQDEVVAFAHSGDGKAGASFLDLQATNTICSIPTTSEPLCIQFGRSSASYQTLLGHRDGSVSMIDPRSRDALYATSFSLPGESFGSATSVQQICLSNLIGAKGSFGSCRIFDARCLSNSKQAASQYQQSTVLELAIPDSMVNETRSVRCTGMAIDPDGRIVIAPYAGRNNDVRFAMWDCSTGALLRTLNVGSVGEGNSSSAFCELSSEVTSGYEMLCKKDSDAPVISSENGSWGLWFKTNVLSSPPEAGGIHHMRF